MDSGVPPLEAAFTVTFLGTAAARFVPPANTAALLVRVGTEQLLVDCGVGAVRQLHRLGVTACAMTAAFLTHRHPDHDARLPGPVRQAAAQRAGGPLRRYAPRAALGAVGAAAGCGRPAIEHVIARGGDEVSFERVRVAAREADHGVPALGRAFADTGAAGRHAVVSGDTRPSSAIASAAVGVDLLVHEATYLARHHALARSHTTAAGAVRLARDSGVGILALTHLGMAALRETVMAEARTAFQRVVVARELDRLVVGTSPPAARAGAR